VQAATVSRQLAYDIAAAEQTAGQTRLQAITAYLEKQYELNTAIQQQKALAESVSTTLGQGMASVFDTLIQGSDNWGKSLQQIASKVLVDIANQLIRIYVIEQAVSAIKSFLSPALPFGGGGGQIGGVGTLGPNYGIKQFANGGVPPVGRPSLVGERGPELFMPGIRGTVIPNGGFGGSTNVVVNVDASGSNVQGDQAQAKQLGVVVSAAVQAELVKQQRPGGLLSGTRR
jgi:phage-related minor tail protein